MKEFAMQAGSLRSDTDCRIPCIINCMIRRCLLLLTIAVIGGCGKFGANRTQDPKEFVWLTRYDVKTLDPAAVQDWTTGKVISYLYPSIGRLCVIKSEKAQKYTLKLRKSEFSDKSPMTSEDIRFTLERCLLPEIQSSIGNQYAGQIKGSKAFIDGKAEHLEGVKIIDGSILTIELDSPDQAYAEKLKNNALGVVNHLVVGLRKPILDFKPGYGAGNWTLESFENGREWKLKNAVNKETLRFRFLGDSANRRNLFDNKEADYAMFAAHEIGVVKEHPDLSFGGPTTLVYLQMNPKTQPNLTSEVRYEIAGLIYNGVDFTKILGKHVKPATSFLELSGLTALPAAGYASGKFAAPGHYEITYAEIGMQNPSVEAMVTALRSSGMDVQGRAIPSGTMLEKNAKGEVSIMFTGWQPDFDGPLNTIPMLFHSKSSENHSGYSNPTVDKLIEAAQRGEQTKNNIEMAAHLIERDSPCVPLYIQRDLVLMRREPPKP